MQSNTGVNMSDVKALDRIEKHHRCGIIYNTLPEYKTVE